MNKTMMLALALAAVFCIGQMAVAQQAEVAAPPAKAPAPPTKAKVPASAEIVIVDPTGAGGTPSGKQIYAKDRPTALATCKTLCPNGGTLTPSIPPSNYWYCTCKSAVAE